MTDRAVSVQAQTWSLNGPNSLLVKINLNDGSHEFGSTYEPNEAAKIFWKAVSGNWPDLQAEIERLERALQASEELKRGYFDEIERLKELLRGVGANRYWEGRWRDAVKEINRLEAELRVTKKYARDEVLELERVLALAREDNAHLRASNQLLSSMQTVKQAAFRNYLIKLFQ